MFTHPGACFSKSGLASSIHGGQAKLDNSSCDKTMNLLRMLIAASAAVSIAQAFAADGPIHDGKSSISIAELKNELMSLPPEIRAGITAKREALARFAGGVLRDRRVAEAAAEAGFDKTEEIKAQVERARRDLVVQKFLAAEAARATANPPDFRALAREQFEVSRATYAIPEAVRIAHILVRVDVEDDRLQEPEMRAKAESILAKLKGGANFSEMAKEFSDDKGSANRGGELPGWVEKGKMVPPFEKAAFALKTGAMSELVRTRFGFHILKQLEYRKASTQEFSAVEAQLTNKARTDFQNARRAEVANRFAGDQDVQIDDATFNAVVRK